MLPSRGYALRRPPSDSQGHCTSAFEVSKPLWGPEIPDRGWFGETPSQVNFPAAQVRPGSGPLQMVGSPKVWIGSPTALAIVTKGSLIAR